MEEIKTNTWIQQGDCLELMKQMPDGKVDLILTDPPYGTTQCKWDTIIPFEPMWEQINRVIKPNGAILIFGTEPFSSLLRCSNIKNFKYDWIYEKTAATGFLNANKRPMSAHEIISVFYKKPPTYNPQKSTGHERKVSTSAHKRNSLKADVYGKYELTSYDSTERYPRTVLKFKTDRQKSALHPTQKPVALLEYLIKTYTNENELVLDFTMGSGSTGVACLATNRKFIGYELDGGYYNTARLRLMN